MSLINKMLRNIDKQQDAIDGTHTSPDLGELTPVKQSRIGTLVILLIIVTLFTTSALLWKFLHHPAPPAAVTTTQIIAAANPPAVAPSPPAPAPVVPAAPVAPRAPSAVASLPEAVPPAGTVIASGNKKINHPAATNPTPAAKAAEVAVAAPPEKLSPLPENRPAAADSGKPLPTQDNSLKSPEKTTVQEKNASRPAQSKGSSMKVFSPQQKSQNLYQLALSQYQQSQMVDAEQNLRQALHLDAANHGARRLLSELQTDSGKSAEAEDMLREGLALANGQNELAMPLARLQLANGRSDEAFSTLEQGLSSVGDDAEYHAFYAALLQERGLHDKAIEHYIKALQTNPSMPSWLIGAGISLKAVNKMQDAAEAFQRALETEELSPEVTQFAEQQLKQIRH